MIPASNGKPLSYRDIARKYGGPYKAHAAYMETVTTPHQVMTPDETDTFGASLDPQIMQVLAIDRLANIMVQVFGVMMRQLEIDAASKTKIVVPGRT